MKTSKRILYISYDCITEPLSASQVLPYLKGLSERNEIFLLTFNKKKVDIACLSKIEKECGIRKIFSLRYHKAPTLQATSFDIACGVITSLYIAIRYNISLIHARSYVAGTIALTLKKILGTPYIFDVRGLLADERLDSGDWKKDSPAYRIVKFLEKKMLKESAHIVILSRRGADIVGKIEKSASKKTSVIPTCVDTRLFSPEVAAYKQNAALRFIYIGSLGTWYMLSEMLDFFKVAHSVIKKTNFMILTQSDTGLILRLIREKGIDEDSVSIKKAAHEDVPGYLRESDASVFFIKPSFSKMASCPTKFAESISMGVPVVTNAGIGDIDSFIRKYSVGVVIEHFEREDYEKALKEISGMIEERGALTRRCVDLAAMEFSLESGIEKYKHIYEIVSA